MADNKPELQRGLEARHIELIALGGTIGVGLFMGAASTLKWAGPSVLLAYIIAGLFVFFIMRSMGRNVVPRTGYRFVRRLRASLYEPVLWLSHRLVLLVYVDGGGDLRNHRHWRLCPVLVPGDGAVDTRIDRGGAGGVGESGCGEVVREIEFWFAMIKVTTIIVMIVIGLGVIFFGFGNGGAVDWF